VPAAPGNPGNGNPGNGGNGNVIMAAFGQMQQVSSNMAPSSVSFVDGLTVNVLSPKPRNFLVTQNDKPLPGNFVTGTTGGGFVALQPYSYVVKTNEPVNDLQSWVIVDRLRNVHK
jgi:hypothetical protein